MILEILVALVVGVLIGTLTGLTPGIHINLVSALLLSTPALLLFPPPTLIAFVIALAITHTLIDYIPSVYLGAPNEDTALSVLPGHELLLKGQGPFAIKLLILGSAIALALFLLLYPLLAYALPLTYSFIERMMGFLLLWISFLLIFFEKNKNACLILFLLSGFLGIASLNLNGLNEPLLPLLSGLFGSSSLIYTLKTKTILPEQQEKNIPLPWKESLKPSLAATAVSPLCATLPGLGSSQASIIGSKIIGNLSREQFLILQGITNMLTLSLSFPLLGIIGKARTGAAATVYQLNSFSAPSFFFVASLVLASFLGAWTLARMLSRQFARHIAKVNYGKISLIVLIFLSLLVFIISGWAGLLVYISSTLLGLFAQEWGVRKSILMGCLLIPTLIYYLPF